MPQADRSTPQASLSVFDAVTIMVGLVVGIGIFRTPSLVAGSVGSEFAFIAVWVLGGLITLIGALCYAELSAAHPHAGGEYHFLSRAYGKPVAMRPRCCRSVLTDRRSMPRSASSSSPASTSSARFREKTCRS